MGLLIDILELVVLLLPLAFFFLLGWLVGVERRNHHTREMEFWKAYAKELEEKQNETN